jgi:molybdopterin molybdotransferase
VGYIRAVLSPAEAEKLIFANIPLFPREDCALSAANGRVLRSDLKSDRDLPPFDRVMMDGYAVRASALAAGVRKFRITAIQAAGRAPLALDESADSCIEIMTGAVLPAGADCVVPYEETSRAEGDRIAVSEAGARLDPGHAVHMRGADHAAGSVLVRAGARLTGREIAVAASCGCATLAVSQAPRIGIISTGDELVDVDAPVAPHQIRRSNDRALRAALAAAGYPGAECFHLHDNREEIEHLLWHILAEFDAVLVTGGVSKGKFDFLPAELDRQRVRKIFHGLAQRPGKPFWFGISSRMTPVFALPGNPVSAYTCLCRYVVPALDRASGLTARPALLAALAAPVIFKPRLARLLPVTVASGPNAELLATPADVETSDDFGGLVGTDGFVELPAEREEFPAGFAAVFRPWY